MGHLSGEEVLTCFKPKSSSKKERTGTPNFWLYAQCSLVRAARWRRWMKIQPAMYDIDGWSIQAKIKRACSFYLTIWLWQEKLLSKCFQKSYLVYLIRCLWLKFYFIDTGPRIMLFLRLRSSSPGPPCPATRRTSASTREVWAASPTCRSVITSWKSSRSVNPVDTYTSYSFFLYLFLLCLAPICDGALFYKTNP